MSTLNYVLIILIPLVAGLFALGLRRVKVFNFRPLLAFSAGILFGTIIMHMFPELLANRSDIHSLSLPLIFLILGFYSQMALEQFLGHSHSGEHGDAHLHNRESIYALVIGFSVHAFIEGLPFLETAHNHAENSQLWWGILLHKIPATFALAALLIQSEIKRFSALILLVLFCLMTPLASLIGTWMVPAGAESLLMIIQAFALGAILHISLAILLESTEHGKLDLPKLLAAILGTLLVIILS